MNVSIPKEKKREKEEKKIDAYDREGLFIREKRKIDLWADLSRFRKFCHNIRH